MTVPMLNTWLQHLQNPLAADCFAQDASMTFVSTAAGANGVDNIRTFLKQNPSLGKLTLDETASGADAAAWVKKRSLADSSVTEEWVWTFVHDEEMTWLLPGVKPTGRRVTIPVIMVAEFGAGDGKIMSKRVYWDQASVMRQIFLLPSDVSKLPLSRSHPVSARIMPALGVEISQRIRNEKVQATANVLEQQMNGTTSYADYASHENARKNSGVVGNLITGAAPVEPVRPSTRLNSAHVGGKSHVFDDAPADKPHMTVDPRRYETHFSVSPVEDVSQFKKEHPFHSQTVKLEDSADMNLGHGKRHDPHRNESQISLADGSSSPTANAELHTARKSVKYENSQFRDHFSSADIATGNIADLNLGHGKRHDPHRNESQISLVDGSSSSMANAEHHTARKSVKYENSQFRDHFSSADIATGNMETRTKGAMQDRNKSQISLGVADSPPEQRSSAPVQFNAWASSSNGAGTIQARPSSRVLREPGGGSSIRLG